MSENENKAVQVVEEDKKSVKSSANDFFKKASVVGKKVADNVQKNAAALSEKARNESYQRRMEKYNPLFSKEYKSKSFSFPAIIKIVDEGSIQSIDVCEGAIGWRERTNDVEILFLSADTALKSGLTFFPALSVNALFCVDSFEDQHYINVERIFSKAHEEKLAELEHIAYSLGAKSCSIELVESDEQTDSKVRDGQASLKILKASASDKSEQATTHSMSGRTTTTFCGSDEPVRPALKWFKEDHSILNLIEMRCSDINGVKSRTLTLEGSSSMTMEQNMARKIDIATAKIGLKLHSSMEKLCRKECSSKLIYKVEF